MRILSKKVRIIIGVGLLVLSLMVIICFIKFGSLMAFLFIYPYALAEIAGFGINPFLAKILTVVMAIVFLGIIGLIFSWGKKRRLVGFSLLALLFILHTLAMFLVSRERFFDLEGQPLKYCSRDCVTDKLNCVDVPGYDKCGRERHAITSEEAKELEAERISKNSELSLSSGEIPCWEVKNWFNTKTGEALIYYEEESQGIFHCHVQSGFSVISGKKLAPVDAESVAKIKTFAAQKLWEIKENKIKQEAEEDKSNNHGQIVAMAEGGIENANSLLVNFFRDSTTIFVLMIFLNLFPGIAVWKYQKRIARIINSDILMLTMIMTIVWINVSFCSSLSGYGVVAIVFYIMSLTAFIVFCCVWLFCSQVIRPTDRRPNHRRCVPPETFLS